MPTRLPTKLATKKLKDVTSTQKISDVVPA
jgi:hypothetical protein